MLRRQLVLVVLLSGVAYLWWQSRMPSRYSEWAEDLASEAGHGVSEFRFDEPGARTWEFKSAGDSTWRVARISDSLVRLRVELFRGDSLTLHLRLDLDPEGGLRRLTIRSAGKQLQVIPAGDSARFVALGDSVTDSWFPWSPQALLFESIPALCETWNARETGWPVTLVRIQPQTEVVVQLPGLLTRSPGGDAVLVAAGKELVRVSYDSVTGWASRLCLAGGRCLERQPGPARSGQSRVP